MRKRHVEMIFVADLHLSHTPPTARSAEDSWYDVQARYLRELDEVATREDGFSKVPIACAGDVFHKWDSPAELINFALQYLPAMYAVPGQHDLPNHNIGDIRKSAFFTLVKAGKVIPLGVYDHQPVEVGPIALHGFPWGRPIVPNEETKSGIVRDIAIVHRYLWIPGKSYHGAGDDDRLKSVYAKLKGYDVAVFGDNHIPFLVQKEGRCSVVNCGSMLRRNIDQIDYKPAVWKLYNDGVIERHYLDVSKDIFSDYDKLKEVKIDGRPLVKFLSRLQDAKKACITFEEAVERYLQSNKVDDDTKSVILSALKE